MKKTDVKAGKIFLSTIIAFAAAPIILLSWILLNGFVAFIVAGIFAGVTFGALKFIKANTMEERA